MIKIKAIGLKDVDFNGYDFHITPVLTYSFVKRSNNNKAYAIVVEWGHWAIYLGYFKIIKQKTLD